MLKLTDNDIQLHQSATEKTTAIRSLAADLTERGMVANNYVQGMLDREAQHSTYLGNGIAIPHGTTDTRSLVKKTGVVIHHFPNGVTWDADKVVYIAIGIAAKSDEHLSILKQLTKVLGSDGVEDQLKQVKTKEQIIALLNGDYQLTTDFNSSLIQLNFPARDMLQLSVVSGGLIKNASAADNAFVQDLINQQPTYLGEGLWLVTSTKAVHRSTMSVVSVDDAFQYQDKPVNTLLTLAVCNASHQKLLTRLSDLIYQKKQAAIVNANHEELLALFDSEAEFNISESSTSSSANTEEHIATYKIKNTHGLHARPGAMLVAEAKKYKADIKVKNNMGDGKTVNAKSLMKVIGLGVKQGHELEFSAQGEDANDALAAIGVAIESGLGEG